MSSKREELRRLKEQNRNTKTAIDTPAEEFAAAAEKAIQQPENVSKKSEIEEKKDVPTKAKKVEPDINKVAEPAETKDSANATEENLASVEKNEAINSLPNFNSTSQPEAPVESPLVKEKVAPVYKKFDATYSTLALGEELIKTSVGITADNWKYLKIRSSQLGMKQQDYYNLLIEEEHARISTKEINPYDIEPPIMYSSTHRGIVLTKTNHAFIKQGAALHGFKPTQYINYILNNEREKEQKYGMRKGLYD